MTGHADTDIRLSYDWNLTQAADGDAPICSGYDCLYQNIAIEAVTQPGDVFYDLDFGWGLYDFIQSEDSELTRLEIMERARTKLRKRDIIISDSIQVTIQVEDDKFLLQCLFHFNGDDEPRKLNIIIGAVAVEVVEL